MLHVGILLQQVQGGHRHGELAVERGKRISGRRSSASHRAIDTQAKEPARRQMFEVGHECCFVAAFVVQTYGEWLADGEGVGFVVEAPKEIGTSRSSTLDGEFNFVDCDSTADGRRF